MNVQEISLLLFITSTTAFSSTITAILINQQKNIIQHPYWDKIFLFQNDYAHV